MNKSKENIFWDELDKSFNGALFSCTSVANLDELIKALKPYPRIYYSYEIKQSIFFSIVAVILGYVYDFSIIEIDGLILFLIFILHGVTFPNVAKTLYPSFCRNEIKFSYMINL